MRHEHRVFRAGGGGDGAARAAPSARRRRSAFPAGTLPRGTLDAITDVAGVRVGHTTLVRGSDVRTGVTSFCRTPAISSATKCPAAVFVGNAFGKLAGSTQVEELGEIETPIALTSTLNVPRVADAILDYMLALPGNEQVRSINPLVGETNDGYLNDIRGRHVGRAEVLEAIAKAHGGAVEEGAVGAGTGTMAFGFKGGIGTASRKAGAYTVGVLVQSNFGGTLQMAGAPVGRELAGARPEFGQRIDPDGGGDGRSGGCAQSAAHGGAHHVRPGAHRVERRQRQRRLRHRLLHGAESGEAADERGMLAAVRGRDRGHRRGDLQLAAAGHHHHGQRPHGGALPIDKTIEILQKYNPR